MEGLEIREGKTKEAEILTVRVGVTEINYRLLEPNQRIVFCIIIYKYTCLGNGGLESREYHGSKSGVLKLPLLGYKFFLNGQRWSKLLLHKGPTDGICIKGLPVKLE
jgi:hypothetical protein